MLGAALETHLDTTVRITTIERLNITVIALLVLDDEPITTYWNASGLHCGTIVYITAFPARCATAAIISHTVDLLAHRKWSWWVSAIEPNHGSISSGIILQLNKPTV